jgi:selenocysteine lyase/cysteine desulfurase
MRISHKKDMQTLKLIKEKKEQERKDTISFSLPSEMIRTIKRLADENEISSSNIAEYALKEFLDSLSDPDPAQSGLRHTNHNHVH